MDTNATTYRKSPDAKRPRMADDGPNTCRKCFGAGGWEHWPGFTCYRCAGVGIDPKARIKVREFPASWSDERCAEWLVAKDAKDAARAEAKQAAAEAARLATFEANVARCPALADSALRGHPFVSDCYWKAHRFDLTDRQVEAVNRVAEAAAEAAEREAKLDADGVEVPATADRIEVVGTIRSVKFVENDFGGSLKMLVEHDTGWKVWGTVPSAMDSAEVGDRVGFMARVERSDDDVRFGFFSRPTKVQTFG